MPIRTSLYSLAIALLISVGSAMATTSDETAAVAAAQKWLDIVDRGEYNAAWESGATFLKDNVGEARFAQQLTNVRKPMGDVISRKVESKKFSTSAPGAPDGKYVMIQFKTSFAHKKSAVETITPSLEKDGVWKVTGYFIK
jgi:hypothetical protein